MMRISASEDPDIAEMRAVLQYICKHRRRWIQQPWATRSRRFCGTAYCFAGHVVLRHGAKIIWNEHGSAEYCKFRYDKPMTIRSAARQILRLSHAQANRLFSGRNSLDDLERIINEIEAAAAA